jgi:hypothetical protein
MTIEDEAYRDRVRQSERTVDNLKRLYAVLFSISFGVLAAGTFDKLSHFSSGIDSYNWPDFFTHAELTIAFVITAGLFYYQGDRVLDVAFAKSPLQKVGPATFGIEYCVNVFTMAPFYLLAQSLSKALTQETGFFWFFISYTVLIMLGLTLLVIREFLRLIWRQNIAVQLRALQLFWLNMNSLVMILVIAGFILARRAGVSCPTRFSFSGFPIFVCGLGIVIFLRDLVDFTHGWAVLYPTDSSASSSKPLLLIRMLSGERSAHFGRALGILLYAILLALIANSEIWRLPAQAHACLRG